MSKSRKNNMQTSVFNSDVTLEKTVDESSLLFGEDVGPHVSSPHGSVTENLNSLRFYNSKRQVCVNEEKMKNLVEVASRTEKRAAGATKPTAAEIQGKIIEYSMWLLKQGYAEATIEVRTKHLKTLMKRGANLYDPESVKEVIAKSPVEVNTKIRYVIAYTIFATMMEIPFIPPKYKQQRKIPWVPLESEVDLLIASCSKKMGTYLQLLKETGMRPGEAWMLEWTDINPKNNTVLLNNPEKGSNPRIFNVSNRCMSILNNLPKKSVKIFGDTLLKIHRTNFRAQRKRVAQKTGNPRISKITFQSLRHLKGTMEYHRTKDILHVMKTLGHRNINNTLVYIDLENAIFKMGNDEFTIRVAKTPKEACQLLEVGFDYVGNIHGEEIFRKRK